MSFCERVEELMQYRRTLQNNVDGLEKMSGTSYDMSDQENIRVMSDCYEVIFTPHNERKFSGVVVMEEQYSAIVMSLVSEAKRLFKEELAKVDAELRKYEVAMETVEVIGEVVVVSG